MAETIVKLKKIIKDLEEQNDDLQVQLDAVTDRLQSAEDKPDPSGGLGGGALLRAYSLFLATLDPGLTVGIHYDLEKSLGHAREFWIDQGGCGEDLD